MRANLFINFYQDKHTERQNEIEICILSNFYNEEIDTVNILCENKDLDALDELVAKLQEPFGNKFRVHPFEGRPTYNNYFKLTENYPDDINIIANTDMVMDVASIRRLKGWNWRNYCLALSRWDFIDHNLNIEEATHFDRLDSQDVWMVKGGFPQIEGIDFGLGIGGCDNKIALLLSNFFEVINPSIDIKTYHYHLSQIRHWITPQGVAIHRLEPPFHLIPTSKLPQ